jgi:putative tributyrin esterase
MKNILEIIGPDAILKPGVRLPLTARCIMKFALCPVLVIALSLSCAVPGLGGPVRSDVRPGTWLRDVKVGYQAGGRDCYSLANIYFPKSYAPGSNPRTLVVLHGYRQQPADWESGTPIAAYADRYNFVLVCPAMSTTLYESRYFPETENRWAPVPGGEYIANVLLPFVRKSYGLAADRSRTGIFGVSTGGRGALLMAAQHAKLFGAAAGLSGDYDSVSMKRDRILLSVYGSYDLNPERWEGEVNILKLAVSLKKTPVFLGHGTNDPIVPPQQTRMLADRLKVLGYDLVVDTEKSRGAGHDWRYWGSLVPDVLKFFDRTLAK